MNRIDLNIAVVIPTYNRCEELSACLDSLYRSTVPAREIIVIDNGSRDGTVKKIKESYPNIILIDLDKNLGATGASNLGFTKALETGVEYILRLDSDTIVAKDLLWQLVSFAQKHPDGGIFSPKIYYFEPSDLIWYAGANAHHWHMGAVSTHRFEYDSLDNSQAKEVDYVWAAAMLINKDVVQITGGFDPDFLVYHEELDFCRRVKIAGFAIWFVPEGKVWHKVSTKSGNAWQAYHWNRSKVLFFRKHARSSLHLISLIVYAYAYLFFRAVFPKVGAGNRGPLADALRGLTNGLSCKISKSNTSLEKRSK